MATSYIVSRNSIGFKVLLGRCVEVTPLPHKYFHLQTLKTLAEKHMAVIKWRKVKGNCDDLQQVSLSYFKDEGFEIISFE